MKTIAALFLATATLGTASGAWADPQDENLASMVHVKLLTTDTVDGTLITVRANDGVVTLDGVVGTEQAKGAAEQLASGVEGVSRVQNQLTIDPTLAAQMQVKPDLARPDTPHEDAAVKALPGTATTGAAAQGQAAMAAAASDADCIGARYRSRLLGQPLAATQERVGDDELRRRVAQALEHDPLLGGSDIRVTGAENGTVRLEGRAQAIPVHRHALLTAFHVPGVCRVASDITSPADAAAAAVAPDAENAEAAASAEGANADPAAEPTAPAVIVPVPGRAGTETGTPVED
jgi:osmotically-inducible protein OsmY